MPTPEQQTTLQQIAALLSVPVISAAIGGITGALGGWLANWKTFQREKEHRAQATFTAIQAEIGSIVKLMEFADYEKGMQAAIDSIQRTNAPFWFEVPVEIELFTKVYSANVTNLGLLKKESLPDIVHFYGNIHGLVMDLEHLKQRPQPFPLNLPQMQLHIYIKDLQRVKETIALGKRIQLTDY